MPTDADTPQCTAEPLIGIDPVEVQLKRKITELWQVHSKANTAISKTREGLKLIRIHLGRRLYELKGLLSRPGRDGLWSSFLAAQGIPRSTADRLVRSHEQTLARTGASCTTGATDESIDVAIQRQVRSLWSRLSKLLTTPNSVEMFVTELRATAERSLASNIEAESSAPVALMNEAGVNKEFADGGPIIFSGMTPKTNAVEHESQILATQQAEAPLPGSTLARPALFTSSFLKETNGGNTVNHKQRSRARAQLRSVRRQEERLFGLNT